MKIFERSPESLASEKDVLTPEKIMDEILKYAIENGMLDVSYIRETLEMNKREEILKKHPYKVWEGKNGKWYTYIPKSDGGRRLVKRDERRKVEEIVIDYWKSVDSEKFKNRFEIWVERQRACGRSDNTLYKYMADYKRFFAGDPFENMNIKDINEEHISLLIRSILERKKIPWRAIKGMFGYLNGVFNKAIIDGIIEKNPCAHVDLPMFRKFCHEVPKRSDAERTVSPAEKEALIRKLEKMENIEKYAVEFSFCVGMRVSEIASLRWSDIDFQKGFIFLHCSEKFDQITKEIYIGQTKTGKERIVPMTKECQNILHRVKEEEERKGTAGEFVFMDENGRTTAKRISNCINNNTRTSEFCSYKTIHSVRRTVNSNMRRNGVPATVAASILGHSEKVNEMNYTYDVTTMDEKKAILDRATSMI